MVVCSYHSSAGSKPDSSPGSLTSQPHSFGQVPLEPARMYTCMHTRSGALREENRQAVGREGRAGWDSLLRQMSQELKETAFEALFRFLHVCWRPWGVNSWQDSAPVTHTQLLTYWNKSWLDIPDHVSKTVLNATEMAVPWSGAPHSTMTCEYQMETIERQKRARRLLGGHLWNPSKD